MIAVQLPSGRRVNVDTDDPKAAAAAARKFVAGDTYESQRANMAAHPVTGGATGAIETAIRGVPFLSELQAGLATPFDMASDAMSGRPASVGKSWTKERAAQQAWVDSFHDSHPIASNLTKVGAMAAPIAAAIMTGGASEIPTAIEDAPQVAKTVGDFLKPVLKSSAKRATTGAGAGYVYGASQPGTVAQRMKSGNQGAAVGAVVGTVAPPVVGAVTKGVADTAGAVTKTVVRAANKASGGALLDAGQTASQRLVESLKADGATPDLIKTAMNSYLKNGATDPSLIDIAARLPSGGANTLALVRAAAAKGAGRGVAQTEADQVAADLQGKAIAHTQRLTPDTRPANVVKTAAEDARSTAADAEYRAPYAEPVDAGPVLPALEGNTGRRAISAAHSDADALRLGDQMTELDKLRAAAGPEEVPTASIGGDQLPASPSLSEKILAAVGQDDGSVPVSLGTLDRTKIALNEAGRAAAKAGNGAQAKGLFERADEIDAHLADQNGDYATARDNYAKASAGIDALDHGSTGLDAMPDDYAANLHDFLTKGGPDAGKMAAIGYRQALTDAIGAPTEGATGTLNKVSTSTNQGRNLGETFGPEGAEAYRAGLKDLVEQLQNARFINPNTGSPTAGRLADMGLVDHKDVTLPKPNVTGILLGAINKIRAGATLTDEERELITRIGVSKPEVSSLNFDDAAVSAPRLPSHIAPLLIGVEAGSAQNPKNQ